MNTSDLHRYQLDGIDHILDNSHWGLFLDMGLGKTITVLTAADILLFEEMAITKLLIIAPKRVVESVWEQEAAKWEHTAHLKFSKIAGNPKQRLAAIRKPAHIYLLGRDNVSWLCGQYGHGRLPFDGLVVDESSSFKNHASERFKSLKQVQPYFKVVGLLAGTPMPNSLLDLWPQIYLLDRGKRLGKNITAYREGYFNSVSRGGFTRYEAHEKLKDEIYELIGDVCISMKAEDYLDMPKRITNDVFIDMPDSLKKKYRFFEKEKVLELMESGRPITAANAGVLCNKLLQFANGAVYDENKAVHVIHDLKLEALEEIMESAQGSPVLVAYSFQVDANRILKHFRKYKPRKMETDKDVRDWNAGKIPMMIMHPASGGHGLNLQYGGHTFVHYGQNWSLELVQQFNARIDRQGQKRQVIEHRIILKGSMDEKVILAQNEKNEGQSALMEAVKHSIREYGFKI